MGFVDDYPVEVLLSLALAAGTYLLALPAKNCGPNGTSGLPRHREILQLFTPEVFASCLANSGYKGGTTAETPLFAERLDAIGDRVSDVLFRNNADDVRRTPPSVGGHTHRHASITPRHAVHDVEHDIRLAGKREGFLLCSFRAGAGSGGTATV